MLITLHVEPVLLTAEVHRESRAKRNFVKIMLTWVLVGDKEGAGD